MAAEGDLEKEVIVHRKGYEGFIFLMKWGTIISMITGLIVILLIRE
ncbi:MAG TPA: aa3-type cytochrome c oxidase subunit IV [Allosphingosinicella sp.]|nr:aa3-type cytochrome c oxidase subunit IV [Allosphingosinicella sp.]